MIYFVLFSRFAFGCNMMRFVVSGWLYVVSYTCVSVSICNVHPLCPITNVGSLFFANYRLDLFPNIIFCLLDASENCWSSSFTLVNSGCLQFPYFPEARIFNSERGLLLFSMEKN